MKPYRYGKCDGRDDSDDSDDEMQTFSKGVFALHPQARPGLPFRAYVQEDASGI